MRVLMFGLLVAVAAAPAVAQTREDTTGIRAAAMDYIEGWWTGDVGRMTRALHPELAKRIMNTDSVGNNPYISNQGATHLVRNVRVGGGTRTPTGQRRQDYQLLDIFQNAASARVDAGGWIDYLHLVKWNGRWVILNVLWEIRRP